VKTKQYTKLDCLAFEKPNMLKALAKSL